MEITEEIKDYYYSNDIKVYGPYSHGKKSKKVPQLKIQEVKKDIKKIWLKKCSLLSIFLTLLKKIAMRSFDII